jgi:hypothetical protein
MNYKVHYYTIGLVNNMSVLIGYYGGTKGKMQ